MDNTTLPSEQNDTATVKFDGPKQVLIAARKLIEKPENWTNKFPKICGYPTCVGFAIERSSSGMSLGNFTEALGFATVGCLVDWNDDPKRTHAEVLAAFDKAIEAAS